MHGGFLRRYFVTGLAVLLPALVTLLVLVYIVRLIYEWVGKYIYKGMLASLGPLAEVDGVKAAVFVIVLAVLVGAVVVVGALASTVIGRRVFRYGERLFMQLPLVKVVYPPAKQVIDFFVSPSHRAFASVVLVQFPYEGCYAVGFVTGRNVAAVNKATGKKLLNVFVPFTPTPATGILLLKPEEEVIYVDLSVEDALKLVISGGVVTPGKVAPPLPATLTAASSPASPATLPPSPPSGTEG